MANILYANNAAGTLAAGITNVSTTLTLNAGQAALFPTPAPPQVFYATLTDAATQTLIEIVQVTAVAGNIMSIVRAQDGTSALSWNAGDILSQRTIALELRGFENAAEGNFAAQAVAITPSTTLGIIGTTSADSANLGSFGEYRTATGGPSPLTNATPQTVAAVSLTNGDWDVSGTIQFAPTGGITIGGVFAGINTAPNAFGGLGTLNQLALAFTPGTSQTFSTPVVRISLPTAGTPYSIFLVGEAFFSAGGVNATAFIRARRVR